MTILDDSLFSSAEFSDGRTERAALEARIAVLMEQLSTSGDGSFPPIVASEVSWTNGDWAACFADLAGALHLNERLPTENVDLLSRVLARVLGFDDRANAFVGDPSDLILSDEGLDNLHARLDRAVHRQRSIADAHEDDLPEADGADDELEVAIEEELELEPSSGPIAARADIWPINEFIGRALRGRLNLNPSYQRADVWPTADAQLLIESILRGIPLPSVIVLKPQDNPAAPHEVVDGKQRLTSILRFIGAHPDAIRRIKDVERETGARLLDAFRNDYPQFRRLWKAATNETLDAAREKELFFPFKLSSAQNALVGDLERLRGKYYSQIRDEIVEVAEDKIEVGALFEQVTEYKIPVIEYMRATHTQIHEVFNLYNKQGKHLNAEEIRNALFHDLSLMRGIMVASGDNTDVTAVAPFLASRWGTIEQMGDSLNSFGFATARYRRSKVLSWVASLLVDDSRDEATLRPRRLSTAGQINAFLKRVKDHDDDRLRDEETLADLFSLLAAATSLVESAPEAWAPWFKGAGDGSQWQELPLVGTLVGVAAAAAVLDDQLIDRLTAVRSEIYRTTAGDQRWERPAKTQTGTQWAYIATVALGTLRLLGVDPIEASFALRARFGQSGLQSLIAIEEMHR